MLNSSVVLTYLYEEEDSGDIFPNPETEIDYEETEQLNSSYLPDDSNLGDTVENNLAKLDKERNPALTHHLSLGFSGGVRMNVIVLYDPFGYFWEYILLFAGRNTSS